MSSWLNKLMRLVGLGEAPPPTPAAESRVSPPEEKISQPEQAPPTSESLDTEPPLPRAKKNAPKRPKTQEGTSTSRAKKKPKLIQRETGYLIVAGLDFGTAYTKCIVRDATVRDPGKAYPIAFNLQGGRSYLFPSVVVRSQSRFRSALNADIASSEGAIDYLKMRLVAEVEGDRAATWRTTDCETSMQLVVAWFLSQVLADVGRECRLIWPDFGAHPDDAFFVNCCVPIAYADGSKVDDALLKALCAANVAVGPAGIKPPTLKQIEAALNDTEKLTQAREYCYTYPETSANLQSYLKSRARQPGLYLFLDVGAGTVDLSFFQLMKDEGAEAPLRYYHAAVLDYGSSRLELKTVRIEPSLAIADVIEFKEGRHSGPTEELVAAFNQACSEILKEVGKGVGDGVVVTEGKLHVDRQVQLRQMRSVKLMFAGGGFTANPYELAARFFQTARQWDTRAPINPLPQPDDIAWTDSVDPVEFSRLSVAYGLSFARYELDGQRFPGETKVNPETRLRPHRPEIVAPSKDEV